MVAARGGLASIAVAGALGLALVATGCGSSSGNGVSSKSAAQILKAAEAATIGAKTVEIDGSGALGDGDVGLDIVAGHGVGGGTISLDSATLHCVVADSKLYLKADEASWDALLKSSKDAKKLADRWVDVATTNMDFASVAEIFNLDDLLDTLSATSAKSKGKVTKVDGVSAIQVTNSKGAVVDVATTGKPYIVAIKAKAGTSRPVSFSDFGTAKAPAPPSSAKSLASLVG